MIMMMTAGHKPNQTDDHYCVSIHNICATITEVNGFAYVVGGMNHDVIKDISRLKLKGLVSDEL